MGSEYFGAGIQMRLEDDDDSASPGGRPCLAQGGSYFGGMVRVVVDDAHTRHFAPCFEASPSSGEGGQPAGHVLRGDPGFNARAPCGGGVTQIMDTADRERECDVVPVAGDGGPAAMPFDLDVTQLDMGDVLTKRRGGAIGQHPLPAGSPKCKPPSPRIIGTAHQQPTLDHSSGKGVYCLVQRGFGAVVIQVIGFNTGDHRDSRPVVET